MAVALALMDDVWAGGVSFSVSVTLIFLKSDSSAESLKKLPFSISLVEGFRRFLADWKQLEEPLTPAPTLFRFIWSNKEKS